MNIDRFVMAVAGVFIMSSLLLAHFHNPNWLWFTAFVGLNLFQASLTGFCPLVFILKKAGVKPGQAFT
ncbi:MAG: DUF2892 domain-containing protein [Chlorobiaceae bacterium]|nr:DUF2892 domain-containing protein [Chlorobiaceae bacterium]NTV61419.1 DUF2892 domain-containing protein [Chlorobiaceae bacterium]